VLPFAHPFRISPDAERLTFSNVHAQIHKPPVMTQPYSAAIKGADSYFPYSLPLKNYPFGLMAILGKAAILKQFINTCK
jgi:hypothetical protein